MKTKHASSGHKDQWDELTSGHWRNPQTDLENDSEIVPSLSALAQIPGSDWHGYHLASCVPATPRWATACALMEPWGPLAVAPGLALCLQALTAGEVFGLYMRVLQQFCENEIKTISLFCCPKTLLLVQGFFFIIGRKSVIWKKLCMDFTYLDTKIHLHIYTKIQF